jgi:hypothetical protein
MQFYAADNKNGPVSRDDTGPGGITCNITLTVLQEANLSGIVMSTDTKNGPVSRDDTGPGGITCNTIITLLDEADLSGIVM